VLLLNRATDENIFFGVGTLELSPSPVMKLALIATLVVVLYSPTVPKSHSKERLLLTFHWHIVFYAPREPLQTVLEQTEVTSQLLRNEQLTISKDLWAMTPKLQQDAETAYKNWITTIPNTSYSPHTLRIKYEDAIWNYISTCRYRNPDGSNSPEKIVKAKDDEDIAYESWVDSLPNKTDPYKTYTKNGSETGYSHDEKRP
jgi:hypothetical protein